MWLIAGLGNPGPVHRNQRHNIGFMALDRIVQRYWPMGSWRMRFRSETQEFSLSGQKVLALKPQTFMNVSGNAVGEAANFYKVPAGSVVVLHDDLDLDSGRVEIKQGGGHGGHNGLKSLDDQIGQDYWRVRLGIGHPARMLPVPVIDREQKQQLVLNHVLGNFHADEAKRVEPVFAALADSLPLLLTGEADACRKALRDALRDISNP